MIRQDTYEKLKVAREKLQVLIKKGHWKQTVFPDELEDLHDLLDTTLNEFEDRNEMENVPDRIFLVIGEDVPEGCDFNELEDVCWSQERTSYRDIEYVKKEY